MGNSTKIQMLAILSLDSNSSKIDNTPKINAILFNGVVYDSKEIDELKVLTESIAPSLQMNKIVVF